VDRLVPVVSILLTLLMVAPVLGDVAYKASRGDWIPASILTIYILFGGSSTASTGCAIRGSGRDQLRPDRLYREGVARLSRSGQSNGCDRLALALVAVFIHASFGPRAMESDPMP
jgi:hypothetical protein